ncbi:phage tail sheath family protein [Caproicibacterium sp. XB1]|uniref:phage tail sheath family protein n=1 Tax=Caproicibacterium sp. XB1 TaxID=3396405 RepID=UPI0039B6FC1F
MALGGGTFIAQNKILPGVYINFISAARSTSMLSERGIAAMPLQLSWGPDGEVFTVTADDFSRHAQTIFGYDYAAEELRPVREIFRGGATKLLAYKLGTATKAANAFATAKYGGTRGNDIQIVIQPNADDATLVDVTTLLGTDKVETQTAATAAALKDNDFVVWKSDAELTATAGTPLTGGADGTITGNDYQTFLDALESYSFHTLGCPSDDAATKKLFVAYTQRMRETVGAKFQMVGYQLDAADYEGAISIENACTTDGAPDYSMVYWLSGAEAGCAVNATCGNKQYDGEYTVDTHYTQQDLENGILTGKLMFHMVDGDVHVLTDINTLVTLTAAKNDDFQNNQVVRVLDQIANDTAILFKDKYLDKVPNNASGRASFASDIVTYNKQLVAANAIDSFSPTDIAVELGNTKNSVTVTETITPVVAMEKLYMSVVVA